MFQKPEFSRKNFLNIIEAKYLCQLTKNWDASFLSHWIDDACHFLELRMTCHKNSSRKIIPLSLLTSRTGHVGLQLQIFNFVYKSEWIERTKLNNHNLLAKTRFILNPCNIYIYINIEVNHFSESTIEMVTFNLYLLLITFHCIAFKSNINILSRPFIRNFFQELGELGSCFYFFL